MKHIFNIVLKLNNHIWKKLQNDFFVEKNEAQTSGFVVAKKAPSLWKKLFWKENSSRLFVRMWSSKPCAVIFLK